MSNRVKRSSIEKHLMYRGVCDGSVRGDVSYLSYSIVTHRDRLLYQNVLKESVVSSTYSELFALRMLLQNALRMNVRHFEVISDCKSVVEMVNRSDKLFKGKNAKRLNRMLRAIREMMVEFEYLVIEHRVRRYVVYADSMCRLKHRGISVEKRGGKVDITRALVVT